MPIDIMDSHLHFDYIMALWIVGLGYCGATRNLHNANNPGKSTKRLNYWKD